MVREKWNGVGTCCETVTLFHSTGESCSSCDLSRQWLHCKLFFFLWLAMEFFDPFLVEVQELAEFDHAP